MEGILGAQLKENAHLLIKTLTLRFSFSKWRWGLGMTRHLCENWKSPGHVFLKALNLKTKGKIGWAPAYCKARIFVKGERNALLSI